MAKILITTMHRGNNYGSALQTFALSHKLQQMGHSPVVLDYIPDRIRVDKIVLRLLRSLCTTSIATLKNGLRGLLLLTIYERVYNTFFRRNVSLTPTKYYTSEEIARDISQWGGVYLYDRKRSGVEQYT